MINEIDIAALRDGSHEAFERIFRACFGRVRAFIFGYVKSEADAEELAQELFVGLWMRRGQLDPARSFSSYLHTAARNTALNFLRHKFLRTGNPSIEQSLGHDGEDELVARETALLIDMAVERMSPQRRTIYRLSRSEGLHNDEIAARLGTTKRNVESQLSAALRDIRRVIATVFIFI